MPETYIKGDFLFTLQGNNGDAYFYNITNTRHGNQWAYRQPFRSVKEMDEYANSH